MRLPLIQADIGDRLNPEVVPLLLLVLVGVVCSDGVLRANKKKWKNSQSGTVPRKG